MRGERGEYLRLWDLDGRLKCEEIEEENIQSYSV